MIDKCYLCQATPAVLQCERCGRWVCREHEIEGTDNYENTCPLCSRYDNATKQARRATHVKD